MAAPLLDSLFAGVKAFVREVVEVAREAVHVVLEEIDRSAFGKAATGLVKGIADRYFRQAQDLAEEEEELAEKFQRDGRQTESDKDRLREIEAQREKLRRQVDTARAAEAAKDLKAHESDVIAAPVSGDDASSVIGVLATKTCECGGTMRIQHDSYSKTSDRSKFYWQCTSANPIPCKRIYFDPTKIGGAVIREANPDLDGSSKKRREIWEQPETLSNTHRRLRRAVGESNPDVTCPVHVLPLKLLPMPNAKPDAPMLNTYQYVCPGVTPEGLACAYSIPITAFAQVSTILRAREGRGIIDG